MTMDAITVTLPRIMASGFHIGFIVPEDTPHVVLDCKEIYDEITIKIQLPKDAAMDGEQLGEMEDELVNVAKALNEYGRRLDKHATFAQLEH